MAAPQEMPQPLQLLGSVVVSTQAVPQWVPLAQPQLLAMQLSPPDVLQVVPQVPQLLASMAVSVQSPPQRDSPPVQPPQVPDEQVWRAL